MQISETIVWHGINIQINYSPEYFGCHTAHLELKAFEPLPMTETGYRSHFAPKEHFDAYNNIIDYVQEWLEKESQNDNWISYALAKQQPTLF